jgi:hypothetical protein
MDTTVSLKKGYHLIPDHRAAGAISAMTVT